MTDASGQLTKINVNLRQKITYDVSISLSRPGKKGRRIQIFHQTLKK